MRVPDEVRKTVGFITYENKLNHELVPVGSMFFLGHDPEEGAVHSMYAVTARHVIEGLRKKGCSEAIIRLNMEQGAPTPLGALSTSLDSWFVHPTDQTIDVTIYETGIPAGADHLVIPFNMCSSKKIFADHEVEVGEEVFISGLFRHHFGKKRNVPIIRIGNLAALNEERIVTESCGEIDAFLIESRSIGGLSGSPVFLNLGIVRKIGGQIKHSPGKNSIIYLLGLVHGHFDIGSDANDGDNRSINTGIAIVVPVESIKAVIEAYEMRKAG